MHLVGQNLIFRAQGCRLAQCVCREAGQGIRVESPGHQQTGPQENLQTLISTESSIPTPFTAPQILVPDFKKDSCFLGFPQGFWGFGSTPRQSFAVRRPPSMQPSPRAATPTKEVRAPAIWVCWKGGGGWPTWSLFREKRSAVSRAGPSG